ncbi:hypothetical protein bthur0004_66120 [Bacillus thuringiensis serovar sotto str. T04001]|nr:hypothetical protein bthur0004_66120 [Bacillus thuringiensis serovar sotto str. T04001]
MGPVLYKTIAIKREVFMAHRKNNACEIVIEKARGNCL